MPQYIDPTCGAALGHRITIPFTLYGIDASDFEYTLGHQDYTVSSNQGDPTVSIKTGRFVDTVSAVNKSFEITLYDISAADYTKIKAFATADFLNYLNTGSGGISLDLDDVDYSGCYIKTPINSSESFHVPSTGEEFFQTITLMVMRPSYTWF